MPDTPSLSDEQLVLARDLALGQLEFARQYVLELLHSVPQERWLEIPDGFTSNALWQAAHLAVAEYGLLLFRQRGRQPEDLELVPSSFRKRYGRGTVASDREDQPTPAEVLERLERIHRQSLDELRAADPAPLREPADMPYAVYPNRLGAILFCPLHEQIHAGHLGMLRRALGLKPIR